MNKKYYRVSCEGIGIYEYLKNYLWSNVANPKEKWDKFINSKNTNWLNKPSLYNDNLKEYYSYFTKIGYKLFLEKTLPLITNCIDKALIKTEIIEINKNEIVYQDNYQIVIAKDKK